MNWIYGLLTKDSVTQTIIIYSFVSAIGIILSKIKVLNISLGITFVLFTGIAVGHFGFDTGCGGWGFSGENRSSKKRG